MRPPASSLHIRVSDDVAALVGLVDRLEVEIPEKRKNPHGGYGSGKGGHHPLSSWNSQVALLVLEIHAGCREIETNIKYRSAGTVRTRGASDRNTVRCLEGLPALCAGCDYATVMLVIKKLDSWIWRGRLVLGDADPVSRLPRLPGQGDPRCPFCQTAGSLRVRHATGQVTCLRPTCRDGDGNRPSGRIEIGAYSGEGSLAWADGTTGVLPEKFVKPVFAA